MAEYSVHRLLSLKKSTEQRIRKLIQESKFISYRQGNKKTVGGVAVEEIEKEIQSSWQKIESLMSNFSKIKFALLTSNAGISKDTEVKKVKVAGKDYTMAELIATSDELYGNSNHHGLYPQLLNIMKNQYATTTKTVDSQHDKIEQQLKDYLAKSVGNDKSVSADEIAQRSKVFHQDGDYVLIDPLNIAKKIKILQDEIETFKQECDATLSEQNALTTVSIDLTTIE